MGKGIVKLGEGNWAVKDGNLLAAKETNGRFKNAEFTVTRGTDATYVGKDGLIKTASFYNLVPYSEDFTQGWSVSDATITPNSITSPIGQDNASTLTTSASGGTVQETLTISDGDLTFSLFVRKGTTNGVRLRIDAATDVNGYFNINDGTIFSQTDDAKIEVINADWYRVSISASVTSFVKASIYTTDGTTSYDNGAVYIWGAQLVEGTEALDYQYTNGKEGIPRIDFTDNTDGHLLLEPESRNLVPYSEDFSQWSGLIALSIGLNQGISPNGSTEANLLSIGIDSSATRHRLYNLFSFVEGDTYTYSLFAKKNENDWLQLMFSSSAFDVQSYANFDLNNGVVGNEGTSTTADIIDYGNGWYRCSITCTASASVTTTYEVLTTNNTNSGRYPSYQSSAAVNVCFLWGAQLEELSYPTSYIPTNGSTVTRDGETCAGAGEAADFNSEEGVLYAEIAALADSQTYRTISLNDGTNNECVRLRFNTSSNTINGLVRDGATARGQISYQVSDIKQFHKAAFKYKSGDCQLWIDGVQRATSTDTFTLSTQTQLNFNQGTSSDIFYGKCKAIKVYKDASIDLATLTS